METREIFLARTGYLQSEHGDVGLLDRRLQRREGCRRARSTPYISGRSKAMRKHTKYVHEGFCGGREETAAKRAQLSFETAMFLSRERIYEQYLCAITSTEYCGPDARGGSPQQSRIEHII
jgi:hypothetical protein